MTTLAAILLTAVVMGYPLHRAHVRLTESEARESEWRAAYETAHSLLAEERERSGMTRLLAAIEGYQGNFANVVDLDERRAR